MPKTHAVTVYAIPNCDTVKKARKWLDANAIAYEFHDYKKAGVDRAQLAGWIKAKGWEVLLNKRGTTFRKLSDEDKADIDAGKAAALMQAYPSMIKRPVVEYAGGLLVGFNLDEWQQALG